MLAASVGILDTGCSDNPLSQAPLEAPPEAKYVCMLRNMLCTNRRIFGNRKEQA